MMKNHHQIYTEFIEKLTENSQILPEDLSMKEKSYTVHKKAFSMEVQTMCPKFRAAYLQAD